MALLKLCFIQKLLVALTFMLFAGAAIAEPPADENIFEQLGTAFKSGSAPNLANLVDRAISGRCISPTWFEGKYKAPALLVVIKGKTTKYRGDGVTLVPYPPDTFDNLSFEGAVQYLKSEGRSFLDITATNTFAKLVFTSGEYGLIKEADGMLIEEVYENPWVKNPVARCYYGLPQ